MNKKILYVDMDGVIADFAGAINKIDPSIDMSNSTENWQERSDKVDDICQIYPTIFEYLDVIDGAKEAITKLSEKYDIYFLSTPMWSLPMSFMGKRIWLEKNFGELSNKKLILTHRKDLAIGDILIDDTKRNGADKFRGEFIMFDKISYNWDRILEHLL